MKQIFFTLSLLLYGSFLMSQTVYTNASGDFQWFNPLNWSNGLPSSMDMNADSAYINPGDSVVIILSMVTNLNFYIENNGTIALEEGQWDVAIGGEVLNNGVFRFENTGTGIVDFDMFTNFGEVYSDEELNNHDFIHNFGFFSQSNLIMNINSPPNFTPAIINEDCATFILEAGADITDGTFTNEGVVYNLTGIPLIIANQNGGVVLTNLSQSPMPTATCIAAPLDIQLIGMNTAVIVVADINNGSDATYCGSVSPTFSLSQTEFNCSHIGSNIVTLTVEDGLGNTATCNATVNVNDTSSPTVTCPSNFDINLDPGECEEIVDFDLFELDNCGVPTVTQLDGSGLNSGDAFPIGTTSLSFLIEDSNGNSMTCSFDIVVNEFQPNDDILVCDDNVQISVASDCMVCITPEQILMGDYGCYDDFEVNVQGLGTNCVDFSTLNAPVTVSITITNTVTGNSCDGSAIIEDKEPPQLDCSTLDVPCTAPFDVANVSGITITDNCDSNPEIILINVVPGTFDCDSDIFISMTRTFQATDEAGNVSTCDQLVRFEKGNPADVVFPDDVIIGCSATFTPDATGFPTLDGIPFGLAMANCNLSVDFDDDISVGNCSANEFTIFRTWTVVDICPTTPVSHIQIIKVQDLAPPTLTCPDDIEIGVDNGLCVATFQLPDPTVIDDCSSVTVTAQVGNIAVVTDLNSELTGIPVNNYLVTYLATDACGNTSSCTINLDVIDDQQPIGICEDATVSLANMGVTCVPAINFDNGSFDNCYDVTIQGSRDGEPFADCVEFDCDDVGNVVMVTLQITEDINGISGLTNVCMLEVTVNDKINPVINCPIDMTIDCGQSISDLSVFGEPTVFDICGATVTTNPTVDIDQCGQGLITIVFTATDPSGNSSDCTQLITVENMTPFDGLTQIDFPDDITIENECPEIIELSVDNLPAGNEPTFIDTEETCQLLAINMSDQIFNIEFPACYKIVRTWTVIDWCQYDETNPSAGGIWTDQQIIKVIDTEAPEITFCPANITVSLGGDCNGTVPVAMSPTTATDCSTDIQITNDSQYADANEEDASGNYPSGIHTVNFLVKDGCGNKTQCTTVITVEDLKAPTPYCHDGINAELQQMPGGIMAMAGAELFDFGSYDNCTPQSALVFNIETLEDLNTRTSTIPGTPLDPPTTDMLTFNCSDIGDITVAVWVTDLEGNSDYCLTNIEIQDNMNLCDGALVAGISGEVMTEMGDEVDEVTVLIDAQSNALPDITVSAGSWAVPDLALGQTYDVVPEKDIEIDNGISTYDLVLLKRHTLNIDTLDSPYKIIAGDINNDGQLSTIDQVYLRKVILQMDEEFPNNESWRFVDMDYNFIDPIHPLDENFPEIITVDGLPPEGAITDFYGIKVGDLNGSAQANSLMSVDDRNFVDRLSFVVENQQIKRGEEIEVQFKAKDFTEILGFQFTFQFDTENLEFSDFTEGNLSSLKENNFGFHYLEEGMITTSWFDLNQPKITDQDNLFSFKFIALADGELSDFIQLNSTKTKIEAYNAYEEMMDVTIEFNQTFDTANGFELLQNRPNPFTEQTEIDFYLPETSEVTLTVFDLSGKTLKTYKNEFGKGWQKMKISSRDITATGVLYYKLETETDVATRKMIVLP